MVKVMAFGSFDVFHKGHEDYLRQAKELGDYLLVVVSRDSNFERFKHRKPRNLVEERLKPVEECRHVDKAVVGYGDDILGIIVENKPDVLCLGYDQQVEEEWLRKGLRKKGFEGFRIVRAKPFHPEKYKSSKMYSGI